MVEWTSLLDVGKSLVELLELNINLGLGLLGFLNLLKHRNLSGIVDSWIEITHGGSLECFDSLDMRIHVIGDGCEVLEGLFGIVDNGLVLQDGAVMFEVDGAGKAGIAGGQALSLAMTFAERLQRGDGLYGRIGYDLEL